MKILRLIGAIGAATFVLGVQAHAQGAGGILPTAQDTPNRQGTRGGNFLHIGIGAKGGAMAGAIGSSVQGPMAWFWNAAGAASTEEFEIAAGRQDLYGDLGLGQSYIGASFPLLGGVIGLHINSLNSGKILRTSELNPFGERLGGADFEWTSTVAGLGYARRLTDRLSLGIIGKVIKEGVTDAGTTWMAADVGTQFNTGLYGFTLGSAIRNIGGTSRAKGALLQRVITSTDGSVLRESRRFDFYSMTTEIPVIFQFSLGTELLGSAESLLGGAGGANVLNAEITLTDGTDISTQYALGVEYGFKNVLFLRGGKRMYNDDRDRGGYGSVGMAGGFGLRFPVFGRPIRFDYSYQDAGALQNIQVFSFEVGR